MIINQSRAAGRQIAEWNGRNDEGKKAVTGIYIYTVKFDQTVLSKKMILLK